MKVRDLLIKILNGEDLPQKIKINKTIYELRNINDLDELYVEKGKTWNYYNFSLIEFYDNEVEILEEEKKIPEKLDIEQDKPGKQYYIRNEYGTKCGLTQHSRMIAETLNEVIDYLHYLKSKGDDK